MRLIHAANLVAVKTVIRNLTAGRDETEVDGPMTKKPRDTSEMLELSGSSALNQETLEVSIPTKASKKETKRKKSVTPSGSSVSKRKLQLRDQCRIPRQHLNNPENPRLGRVQRKYGLDRLRSLWRGVGLLDGLKKYLNGKAEEPLDPRIGIGILR